MHELSICRSIADIAARHAGEQKVSAIHLRVGQLRQVVPDTLVYCWSLVSAGTPLAGSVLEVESVRARLSCRQCGAVSEMADGALFACRACESRDIGVVAGEEFLITSLELAGA